MSKGVNKVQVIGNLGQAPELKYTESGNAMCYFTVACNYSRKDGDKWVDETEWVPVTVFGKVAENCGQYLDKGSQVYVEGRFNTRSYEDKDGRKVYRSQVVGQNVMFLSRKSEEAAPPVSAPGDGGFYDEKLPF